MGDGAPVSRAGAGLGLMAATWTLMALLGLGIVFELFPAVYVTARIAGAGYLLYLGVPDLAGRIGTGRGPR